MAILITGATGFIGSHLLRTLHERGRQDIVVLCRLDSRESTLPFIRYTGDLKALVRDFQDNEITGVVHLASLFLSQHKLEDIDALIESNLRLGLHLAEAAAQSGCRWFLNTSSFWQNYENKEYSPVSLYAATKRAFEDLLQYYAEGTSLRVTHLHLFDSYGPDDHRPKLFNLLRRVVQSGESLAMSPGDQKINLVHVVDIVEAYWLLLKRFEGGLPVGMHYSVSADVLPTLKEVVELYGQILGKCIPIQWGGRPHRPREMMEPRALYPMVPGWTQSISLQRGLSTIAKEVDPS
jgi:nucleoside-diphosphate-sugar epimerase